jgi:peptidoglycan/LPS O-acetylase OafA/YrhL
MNPNKSAPWSGGRLTSIDALRGIAALCVVLYHAVGNAGTSAPQSLLEWPVIFLQTLSSFGYVGVFLFFVISGFCIHLRWAKAQAAGTPYTISFGAFWKRRFLRLYPAYLIVLAIFLGLTALTVGIKVTSGFIYDVTMHVFMLHNLDPKTAYSINGVFWTLAIEEQLYLAYFLLLFLRKRWGWRVTLLLCAAARVGWFFFSHGVWALFKVGVPIPEAAASHWLTWALGAVSVEAAFGLIKLPRWCRNLWLGAGFLLLAAGISQVFPVTNKDGFIHRFCWLALHPAWGVAFFIIVNRAFEAEKKWRAAISAPALIKLLAWIGLSSYSLYLTHSLVIMQSWRFVPLNWPPLVSALVITTPATVVFAWVYYQFCERPFMSQSSPPKTAASDPLTKPTSDRIESQQPIFANKLVPLVED